MKRIVFIVLGFVVSISNTASAKICYMMDPLPKDDLGQPISNEQIEESDREISLLIGTQKTLRDKLITFIEKRDHTSLKPVMFLASSEEMLATLERIADIQNDAFIIAKGSTAREKERLLIRKRGAIELIGRFCDKEAGIYLVESLKDKRTPQNVVFSLGLALSYVNENSEWKQEFKGILNDEDALKKLDTGGTGAPTFFIRGFQNVGDQKDLKALERYRRHPDKRVRDMFEATSNKLKER
jgi:hypothetical protein